MKSRGVLLIMLIVLVVLFLASCAKPAQEEATTSNGEFVVELLFEKDGYRVYRFRDAHFVYYVVPSGQVYSQWSESCGKGCTNTRRIQSVTAAGEPQ